jgi:hypothetical protein
VTEADADMGIPYVPNPDLEDPVVGPEVLLRAPFSVLVALFGAPADHPSDKVSTVWSLRSVSEPHVELAIRDPYDEDESNASQALAAAREGRWHDWTVAGPSERDLRRFCRWLSAEVATRSREGARQATPASRARINALLAEGKTLEQALAAAADWEDVDPPDLYAWPIPGRGAG